MVEARSMLGMVRDMVVGPRFELPEVRVGKNAVVSAGKKSKEGSIKDIVGKIMDSANDLTNQVWVLTESGTDDVPFAGRIYRPNQEQESDLVELYPRMETALLDRAFLTGNRELIDNILRRDKK